MMEDKLPNVENEILTEEEMLILQENELKNAEEVVAQELDHEKSDALDQSFTPTKDLKIDVSKLTQEEIDGSKFTIPNKWLIIVMVVLLILIIGFSIAVLLLQ